MAVVAAALALLGAGCRDEPRTGGAAGPRAVETVEVEDLLVETQRQAAPGLDVRDPSCPARVVVTEGATFPCTVVVEGIPVTYQVTLADVDTPTRSGRYDIRPARAVVVIGRLVEALATANPGARIDCGPEKVKVLEPGQVVRCVVGEGPAQQTVTFRVDDVLGNLTVVPAG